MNITNDYRRELKSKIIEYAMNEFRQRGIKAVKMDEISRGLHVSKRTVYEIFGDKEDMEDLLLPRHYGTVQTSA